MESDNWIVQTLNSALGTWNEKLAEIWTLLTQDPETLKGGTIWQVMTGINDTLKAIGYGLLVLFFAVGIVRTCASYADMKKPEHVVLCEVYATDQCSAQYTLHHTSLPRPYTLQQ